MAQHQSENTVLTQMERIGEIDAELDDLSIYATSSEAIFDRLEEHARVRLEVALELAPEERQLRPIPADLDPAYLDRLENYFESLYSGAHEQEEPGGRIVAESAANDGNLAVEQLQCAIEGRRRLAEGNTEAVGRLMFVCMRALRSYDGRLMSTYKCVTKSLLVRRRSNDWDTKGNRRERRLHELRAERCTPTEAGQKIAKEENPGATREEIQKKGANVIRSLRERFKRRGEPFPSPTRQAAESPN